MLRRVGELRHIRRVECDIGRPGIQVGYGQDVGQPDPGPGSGGDRGRAPRVFTGDRLHGDQIGAAVACALQRRGHFVARKPGLQLRQGQRQRDADQAVDGQSPALGADIRDGAVVAAVEPVNLGQIAFGEHGGVGLRVVRLGLMDHHVRTFVPARHLSCLSGIDVAFPAGPRWSAPGPVLSLLGTVAPQQWFLLFAGPTHACQTLPGHPMSRPASDAQATASQMLWEQAVRLRRLTTPGRSTTSSGPGGSDQLLRSPMSCRFWQRWKGRSRLRLLPRW